MEDVYAYLQITRINNMTWTTYILGTFHTWQIILKVNGIYHLANMATTLQI